MFVFILDIFCFTVEKLRMSVIREKRSGEEWRAESSRSDNNTATRSHGQQEAAATARSAELISRPQAFGSRLVSLSNGGSVSVVPTN